MTAASEPAPTVLVSWAHAPNVGVEVDDWRQQVLHLTYALRRHGVDADVDLFHIHEPGINWSHWGPQRIPTTKFTLVAVNRAWRERFEGFNAPTVGAGVAAEANVLHGLFTENQKTFAERLLIVVLPGATERDVPTQLSGYQRFQITGFTLDDLEDLLRTIYGNPGHPKNVLGDRPGLPNIHLKESRDFVDEGVDAKPQSTGASTAESPVDPVESSLDVISIALESTTSEPGDFGTDSHAEVAVVPGVAEDGQETVRRQLAVNPTASVVREFLAEITTWDGIALKGIKRRGSTPGQPADFSEYLRIDFKGSAVGYLYVGSGRLNPKVSPETFDSLDQIAPTARRIASSNPAYRASTQVADEMGLRGALTLLRRASE